jgi:hypothetical protein
VSISDFKPKITSGGGGLCEAQYELYSDEGKKLVSLKAGLGKAAVGDGPSELLDPAKTQFTINTADDGGGGEMELWSGDKRLIDGQ